MESIIIILFIVAIISFALQLQLHNNKWITLSWLLIIGIGSYSAHHICIEQSYSSIKESMSNHALMMNFVVLQIIEALGGILLSIYNIRSHYNEKVNLFFKYFNFVPGIIVFPALFYFETFTFLLSPGIPFVTLALAFALIAPTIIGLIKIFFKVVIPEFELQIETKFFMHLIQLIGGIWLSIALLRLPVPQNSVSEINPLPIVVLTAIIAACIIAGLIWYNYKFKKIEKSIQ